MLMTMLGLWLWVRVLAATAKVTALAHKIAAVSTHDVTAGRKMNCTKERRTPHCFLLHFAAIEKMAQITGAGPNSPPKTVVPPEQILVRRTMKSRQTCL